MKGKKVLNTTNVLFYACVILLGVSLVMRFFSDLPGAHAFFALSLIGFTSFHLIRLVKFGVRKRTTYHWAYSIVFILMAVVLFAKYQYRFFGHYLGIVVIPLFGLMALHYLMAEKERDRRTSILMGAYFLLAVPLFTPDFKEGPLPYIPWWIEMGSTVQEERFDNGQLKEQVGVSTGVKHGSYRTFYKNGQLKEKGWYVDGMKNGTFREYYPNGKLKKVYYAEDGKQNGMYKEYHKNGNIKYKGLIKDGKKVGKHVWYYKDGSKKKSASYKNGEEEGKAKTFYKNGELKSEAQYKNGYNHGLVKFFYKDGSLKDSSFYRNGKREGFAKTLYKNGNTKMLGHWVKDSLIFYKKFTKTGELKDAYRRLLVQAPDTTYLGETFKATVHFGGFKDTIFEPGYDMKVYTERDSGERIPDSKHLVDDSLKLVDGKKVIKYQHDSAKYRSVFLWITCDHKRKRYSFTNLFYLAEEEK